MAYARSEDIVTSLDTLQTTIRDLKEIVQRNQGANHEASVLVQQMEQLVVEIRQKQSSNGMVVQPSIQPIPIV